MDSIPAIQQPKDSVPKHDGGAESGAVPGCLFRVGAGPKGRGLFASERIPPLTVIHTAPCLLVSKQEYDAHMRFTILEHYLFNDPFSGSKLLALGYGSLFNHSRQPNVNYRLQTRTEPTITYFSGPRPISEGEELCISYGSNLWFEDADGQGSASSESSEASTDAFLDRITL